MSVRLWRQAVARSQQEQKTQSRPQPFTEYADRPNDFFRDCLRFRTWSKLRTVADQLVTDRYVFVRAAHNVGKTMLASAAGLWFLNTHEDSIVLTTANSWAQVENQIWRQMRAFVAGAPVPLLGRTMHTAIDVAERWFAMGFSTDNPESVAGYHARMAMPSSLAADVERWDDIPDSEFFSAFKTVDPTKAPAVFVIVDEASKVPDAVWDVLDSLMTNPASRMLALGNPTRTKGRFFEAFNSPKRYPNHRRHTIAHTDAPYPIRDDNWVAEQQHACGPDYLTHPRYQVRVLGLHPTASELAVFPRSLLMRCADLQPLVGGRHMGVDIGRTHDPCVALLLVNGRVAGLHRWGKKLGDAGDLMAAVDMIRRLGRKWEVSPSNTHVEIDGLGSGVYDRLWEAECYVDGVLKGGAAVGDWDMVLGHRPAMRNERRQELLWIAQMGFYHQLLSVPDDERYQPVWDDLLEVEFDLGRQTRHEFEVESNDDFRARTGRSADVLAAFLCALSRTDALQFRAAHS